MGKKFRQSRNCRALNRFVLLLIIVPFLVGFDLPDSSGVFLRGSAGTSRYSYSVSGCDSETDHLLNAHDQHLELFVKYSDYYAGFSHQWLTKTEKEIRYSHLDDNYKTEYPEQTSSYRYMSGYIGRNFSLIGLTAGVQWKTSGYWAEHRHEKVLPVIGLRANLSNTSYLSASFNRSMPLFSGGYPMASGVGIYMKTSEIWVGTVVNYYDHFESAYSLKFKQSLPWLDIRTSGLISFGSLYAFDYGISMGIDIRLLRL